MKLQMILQKYFLKKNGLNFQILMTLYMKSEKWKLRLKTER